MISIEQPAAESALAIPARRQQVGFSEDGLQEVLKRTQGYPYFLQEWGKHIWECADASPIVLEDVLQATQTVLAELDASFFRMRFDRLTPLEKQYMRAMAELGPGPYRSGEIARVLAGKTRKSLLYAAS